MAKQATERTLEIMESLKDRIVYSLEATDDEGEPVVKWPKDISCLITSLVSIYKIEEKLELKAQKEREKSKPPSTSNFPGMPVKLP
jgi:hypothetical protein